MTQSKSLFELIQKDVRAKIFLSIEFFIFLLPADNELPVPEMEKELGVTVFFSEIKRVVNYTDFLKLSHIIEHGLQRFIVKNIEVSQGRQTILTIFVGVGLLRK